MLDVRTDGPTSIRLNGRVPARVALTGIPGATVQRDRDGRGVVIDIPSAVEAMGSISCGRI